MRRLSRTTTLRALGAAALASAVLAAAGCGSGSSDGDAEAGKQLFVQSCGACHALEDAGTTARIGPNLDDAFRAARQAGFEESQFEGVTRRWIQIGQAPMPRNIVVGQDADDVAAYVAAVAGTDEASAVGPAPDFDQVPRDPQADIIDATPDEPEGGE